MQLGALKAVLDSFAFMDILMDRFVSFLSPFIPRGERERERMLLCGEQQFCVVVSTAESIPEEDGFSLGPLSIDRPYRCNRH